MMATRKPGTVAAVNRAIDAIIKKNPTKPSPPKRRVKLIAMNPNKRESDVPGDFSQSSAKVYGRAWSDAEKASIKDVDSDAVVRLTWKDGEWLQMVFDSRAAAVKNLHRLGFK